MRIFCTFCGEAHDLAAPKPNETCRKCQKIFTVPTGAAPLGAGPAAKSGVGVLVIVGLIGVGGLCLVAVVGMLAAIAIPNFIRYQARAKQSEVRSTLRMFYTAEMAFYAANERYTTNLGELGASVESGNRYAYFADLDGTMIEPGHDGADATPFSAVAVDHRRNPSQTAVTSASLSTLKDVRPGMSGTCPNCEITLVAAGNIDSDATLDVWSISTAERREPSGGKIAAGSPHQDVDDLRN